MRIIDLSAEIKKAKLTYASLEVLDACAACNGQPLSQVIKATKRKQYAVYKHLQTLRKLGYIRSAKAENIDGRQAVIVTTAHGYLVLEQIIKAMKSQEGGL